MGEIMVILSVIIRTFYLPNPFESLGTMGIVYNLMLSSFLVPLTFIVVGMYYNRGSFPFLGSLLFLVFYVIHNELILVMSIFNFAIWWIAIVIFAYIMVHTFICKFRNSIIGGVL